MTQQVTISISQPLYQRMRNLALAQNQPVADLLETAVTLVETAVVPGMPALEAMAREEAAYQAMHRALMARHQGDYVAIYRGEVVDYDSNETSLLQRIDQNYADKVVLMKQVKPLPEPELRFRSPRLVRGA